MNAGTDYAKAREHAQANANYTNTPRWLHYYRNTWWISRTPIHDSERIAPAPPAPAQAPAGQDEGTK